MQHAEHIQYETTSINSLSINWVSSQAILSAVSACIAVIVFTTQIIFNIALINTIFLMLAPHVVISIYDIFLTCKIFNHKPLENKVSDFKKILPITSGVLIGALSSVIVLLINFNIPVTISMMMVLIIIRTCIVWYVVRSINNNTTLLEDVNSLENAYKSKQADEMLNVSLFREHLTEAKYLDTNTLTSYHSLQDHECRTMQNLPDSSCAATIDQQQTMEFIRRPIIQRHQCDKNQMKELHTHSTNQNETIRVMSTYSKISGINNNNTPPNIDQSPESDLSREHTKQNQSPEKDQSHNTKHLQNTDYPENYLLKEPIKKTQLPENAYKSKQAQKMLDVFLFRKDLTEAEYLATNTLTSYHSPIVQQHTFRTMQNLPDSSCAATIDQQQTMKLIRKQLGAMISSMIKHNKEDAYYGVWEDKLINLYSIPNSKIAFENLFTFLATWSGNINTDDNEIISTFSSLLYEVLKYSKFTNLRTISLLEHFITLGVCGQMNEIFYMHYLHVIANCGHFDIPFKD